MYSQSSFNPGLISGLAPFPPGRELWPSWTTIINRSPEPKGIEYQVGYIDYTEGKNQGQQIWTFGPNWIKIDEEIFILENMELSNLYFHSLRNKLKRIKAQVTKSLHMWNGSIQDWKEEESDWINYLIWRTV